MRPSSCVARRRLLRALLALGAGAALRPIPGGAQQRPMLTRPIPSSGEALPVVGLGSWITFNVGDDRVARDACTEVMRSFFDAGGRMIDSSPMYGSSQEVIGYGLARLGKPSRLFSADKVWISSGASGRGQIEKSRRHWNVARFDVVQVHNLLSWQEHLPTLFAMKAAGELRYVGVTTSEGRRHREVEQIMASQPLDFVQVSYSAVERDVEARILPLARDRGIGVIVNRPFREGALIRSVKRHPLPAWAGEIDCANWAEILLKFIVSHPAVTCAIPATADVAHIRENMGAAYGRLPDESMRRRMAAHIGPL
jgi:diketogulonate reductase-like aldo/keto reductase